MSPHRTLRLILLLTCLLVLLVSGVSAASLAAPVLQNCYSVVNNGGFETGTGWVLSGGALAAKYVNSPVRTGSWAMQLGNLGQSNPAGSSWMRQTVTVPANVASAEISFWVWTTGQPDAGSGVQELLFMVPGSTDPSQPMQVVWRQQTNNPSWQRVAINVNNQIGRTFDLYFNITNLTAGGNTAMALDDVVLAVCPGAGVTPTPPAQSVIVTQVGGMIPNGYDPRTINTSATLPVSVQVYAAGVTNQPTPSPYIKCGIQYAKVDYFGGPWLNTSQALMAFQSSAPPNQRYQGFLGPLQPGYYEFLSWCQGTGNSEPVMVDKAANGGFSRLTVQGAPTTPFPTLTPTPTPTPPVSPLPTPVFTITPPNCVDVIVNGGFESQGGWTPGWDPIAPAYNGNPSYVQTGLRSMGLGAIDRVAVKQPAYSSIRQDVYLSPTAKVAGIRFWYYPISSASAGGLNRQELILLDPLANDETIKVLWRVTENANAYGYQVFDLTPYLGRTVSIYFNARNAGDGKYTAMYLDEVSVLVCNGPMPAAQPFVAGAGVTARSVATMAASVTRTASVTTTRTPIVTRTTTVSDRLEQAGGPTIVSVNRGPVTTGPTADPDAKPADTPRSQRRSLFDGIDFQLDTPLAVFCVTVGIIALIAVGIRWTRNRSKKNNPGSGSGSGSA